MSEGGASFPLDVSVILPTRNRSALLSQTLRSVLWQQDVDFEVIVVDEASTDDTLNVVAAFADHRIRVLHNDAPTGVAAARNRGVADAGGEWLAFIDDDDLWAPDKLRLQLQEARALRRDWVYGGAVIIDLDSRLLRAQHPMPVDETVAALLRYDAIPGGGSGVVVRRALLQRTGPFDPHLPVSADWELYIRLAKTGLPACVPRPLVARRLHSSNLSLDVAQIVRETLLIETLHQTKADWGRLRRWLAHSCLRAGRRRAAIGQFAKAAVQGQLGNVATDVAVMLRQAITRRILRPRDEPMLSADAWIQMALVWLEELRRTGERSTGTPASEAGVINTPVSAHPQGLPRRAR